MRVFRGQQEGLHRRCPPPTALNAVHGGWARARRAPNSRRPALVGTASIVDTPRTYSLQGAARSALAWAWAGAARTVPRMHAPGRGRHGPRQLPCQPKLLLPRSVPHLYSQGVRLRSSLRTRRPLHLAGRWPVPHLHAPAQGWSPAAAAALQLRNKAGGPPPPATAHVHDVGCKRPGEALAAKRHGM